MENIFRPNKWFVMFCGLLVCVWLGLQLVATMRLADEAKLVGKHVFTWEWPAAGLYSSATIGKADVIRRSDTDAIVKVKGEQLLTSARQSADGKPGSERSEVVECGATLTFYKSSNDWVLGRVELE
jgi:hypothetical protein